ncbi:SDR family NAD(P)-dependent oxidoreductase [Phytohabitans suffuscus]
MKDEPPADLIPDYAALMRLDGQVHVVLGAGNGMGQQSAHALAAFGATVVCVDLDATRAEAVAGEVKGIAWSGDITSRADVRRLFADVVAQKGRLDGVIDIVGLARARPVVEYTDDDWAFHHDIVLRHAYLAIQYATEQWRALGTGGAMTFVASAAGLLSAPGLGAYGAAKAALMSLVRTAAVELGPDGIRVNAVAPGVIRTPRAQGNPKWTDELVRANIDRTPLRKLGYPPDVAGALLFFSSPLAGHVTGQTLVVDGGAGVVFNCESPS